MSLAQVVPRFDVTCVNPCGIIASPAGGGSVLVDILIAAGTEVSFGSTIYQAQGTSCVAV